jgi:hypothetical protein
MLQKLENRLNRYQPETLVKGGLIPEDPRLQTNRRELDAPACRPDLPV